MYSQGGSPSPTGGGGTGVDAAVGTGVGAMVGAENGGEVGGLVGRGVGLGVAAGVTAGVTVGEPAGVADGLNDGTAGAGCGPPIGPSSARRTGPARKETLRTTPSTVATAGETAPWSWAGGVRGKAMPPAWRLVAPTTTVVHPFEGPDVQPPGTAIAHRRRGA